MSTKRLEHLQEKYPQISKEDFTEIVACDFTPTKKYSDWLLRLYSQKKFDKSNLAFVQEIITIHNDLKDDVAVELKDIMKFDSPDAFMFTLNKWLVKRFEENEKTTSYLRKGAELIFENDDVFIVRILSHEGSVNFGSNTSWCTLQISDYVRYAKSNSLYIISTKTSKLQPYFSSKTQLSFFNQEFRNKENKEVDLIRAVVADMSLYKPIKSIFQYATDVNDTNKKRLLTGFFTIEHCQTEVLKELINKYSFEVLKAYDVFTTPVMSQLFEVFGEQVFPYLPNTDDTNRTFVVTVKDGLKILYKKGKIPSADIHKDAVEAFPENILMFAGADDALWRFAVRMEAWLINMSPFWKQKNASELINLIDNNYAILSYIDISEALTEAQRFEVAIKMLDSFNLDTCEYFPKLKITNEDYQLQIVDKYPDAFEWLKKPSEKVKAKHEEFLKKKREEEAKRLEEEAKKKAEERKRREAKIQEDKDWMDILAPKKQGIEKYMNPWKYKETYEGDWLNDYW